MDRYIGRFFPLLTTKKDDSKHIISVLRIYFAQWGIPVELTTDGASVYVSEDMEEFLSRYGMGVKHRVSSNYYPRGNNKSDVAVKSAKQLAMGNCFPMGPLIQTGSWGLSSYTGIKHTLCLDSALPKLSRSISYGITFPYNLRNFNPGQRGTKKLTKKSEPSRNSMF